MDAVPCFGFDIDLDYWTEWGPDLNHPRRQEIGSSDHRALWTTRITCKGFWLMCKIQYMQITEDNTGEAVALRNHK